MEGGPYGSNGGYWAMPQTGGGGGWLDNYANWFNNTLGGGSWSQTVGGGIYAGLVGSGLMTDETLANTSDEALLAGTAVTATVIVVGGYYGAPALAGVGAKEVALTWPTFNWGVTGYTASASGVLAPVKGIVIGSTTSIVTVSDLAIAGTMILALMTGPNNPMGPSEQELLNKKAKLEDEISELEYKIDSILNESKIQGEGGGLTYQTNKSEQLLAQLGKELADIIAKLKGMGK
jgi:hypothetical protein